jgi:hypothetical protein
MKSISWQSFASRKFAKLVFTIAVVLFWTACSDSSQNVSPNTSAGAKGSSKSTSNFGDYNVSVVVSTDGATWTYTITKNAGAKNLSHFIVNLDNCGAESATFDDILWATVNGSPVVFTDTEGKGTGCDPQSLTSNFVKFDNLGAASSYVIVVKFDRGYQLATTTGWLKAGTSCNSGSVPGPGCPVVLAYCSMSQGYYFAKGSDTNGSDSVWTAKGGVTLGGNNYSHAEGSAIWDLNTAHKRGVIKAFFQFSAIQLSGTDVSADVQLAADMATIDAYYTGKAKITTSNLSAAAGVFPDDAAVSAAQGRIGQWIDAHHCGN